MSTPPAATHERLAGLAMMAVMLGALWPMRGALAAPATTLVGVSIDTVHHAWGLWHVAAGSHDDTFWPVGAYGTVIGGPSVILGALLTPWVGAAGAFTATCVLQLWLALGATGWLAVRAGGGPWAAPAAALLLLCGRPLLAQVGWGVPEGAAVGWLALALAIGLAPTAAAAQERPPRAAGLLRGVATGALLAASIVENPYTLMAIAPIALGLAWRRGRTADWSRLGGEALGGGAGLGVWLAVAHGSGGGLGTTAVGKTWEILGLTYVAEGADGRAHLPGLLRVWEPLRYEGGRMSELLGSGAADTLGWLPVALSLAAAWKLRPARAAVAAGLAALALAFGSFPFGDASAVPGPFFFANLALGLAVRPLTQPVRFLVLVSVALAVAGGLLVGSWAKQGRKGWVAAALALAAVEARLSGSPSADIPTFDLGRWSCLAGLPEGAVASDLNLPPFQTAGAAALAAQMVHQQPGTHSAIGGWTPRAERSVALESALSAFTGSGAVPAGPLARQALRGADGRPQRVWDLTVPRALGAEGVTTLLIAERDAGGLPIARTCAGISVVDLRQLAR